MNYSMNCIEKTNTKKVIDIFKKNLQRKEV